jgi:hypothetical protein
MIRLLGGKGIHNYNLRIKKYEFEDRYRPRATLLIVARAGVGAVATFGVPISKVTPLNRSLPGG